MAVINLNVHRRYFFSLLDQVFLSLFNFGLNLFLIKIWQPAEYGTYVLWMVVALFFVGIQNSLISTPLSVFSPSSKSLSERLNVERAIYSVNIIFTLVVFFTILLINFAFSTWNVGSNFAPTIISLFVSGNLVREYARAVGFARQRVGLVVLIDCIYIITASSVFIYYLFKFEKLDAFLVFNFLFFASFSSGLVGILLLRGYHGISLFNKLSLGTYSLVWKQSKWALLGVIATELQSRAHVYFVTAIAGNAALGILSAAEILFRPMSLLLTAWSRVARPHLAEASLHNRWPNVTRVIAISTMIFLIFLSLYYVSLILIWPTVEKFIYGDKYGPIGWLVVGWGISAGFGGLRSIMSTALQSFKNFKVAAFGMVLGGGLSVLIVINSTWFFGYKWSITGPMLGNLASFLFVTVFLLRRIRYSGRITVTA